MMMMMMNATLLLCLSILFVGSNTASANDILCAYDLSRMSDCIAVNQCESQCGNVSGRIEASSCSQVNSMLCEAFSCCDECYDPIEAYFECALGTVGFDCDLECSSGGSLRNGWGWMVLVAATAVAHAVF